MQRRAESSSFQPQNVSDTSLSISSGPQQARTREYSKSRADLDNTDLEDEDYNPEDDEVESSEVHLDNLYEREERMGVERRMNVTSKEVFSLPAGRQVVLPFSRESQPNGEADGLLSTVLGSMACDFTIFRICVRSWKQMTKYKEHEYNRRIKDDRQESKKQIILTKLGKIWRDTRGYLFNKLYDETQSLVENFERRCPKRIDKVD
ncbi:hypothetical protein PIB30_016641 [Stylosanthes scabra]|uniref:Uncharacterized protein n=1 Tax=Stylosanthes scabra TaxID=79078 RepID=A0ABU6V6S7_9FABA|nr:hypothetical protein [Stylosanthes scabra]